MYYKIFRMSDEDSCRLCNRLEPLYILGEDEEEARRLFEQFGGMCSTCLVEDIIASNYVLTFDEDP
jgi:hypothetical protein